jgi:VanZ family protein
MKRLLRYFFYYWLPLCLYGLLIFILSSGPAPAGGPEFFQADKVAHFFIFAGLGALCLRTLHTTALSNSLMTVLLISMLLSSGYGISDEIHQYFVPSRSSDVFDAIADITGSIVGVLVYWRFFIQRRGVTEKVKSEN